MPCATWPGRKGWVAPPMITRIAGRGEPGRAPPGHLDHGVGRRDEPEAEHHVQREHQIDQTLVSLPPGDGLAEGRAAVEGE
jgi:hypothetical protein